mmetsp:Transcript_59898/g.164155  ORF Transcript_59898/g.164155 Transcript_59898/m.164155 type:complete len:111 (-) Transcript_59898:298-630(-)
MPTQRLDAFSDLQYSGTTVRGQRSGHWQHERAYGKVPPPGEDFKGQWGRTTAQLWLAAPPPAQREPPRPRPYAHEGYGPAAWQPSPYARKRKFLADALAYGSHINFFDGD